MRLSILVNLTRFVSEGTRVAVAIRLRNKADSWWRINPEGGR
jgi:hypothetical protein